MPNPLPRLYALAADDGGDGLPYLNTEGAFIGQGTPLLEMNAAGCWTSTAQSSWLWHGWFDGADGKWR